MRAIFVLLLGFYFSLFAEDKMENLIPSSSYEVSDLNIDEDWLIGGGINPLSGQVCLKKTDLIVKGAQDIRLDRTYIAPFLPLSCHSNPGLDKFYRYSNLLGHYRGFVCLPHLKLVVLPNNILQLVDQNGAVWEFEKTEEGYKLAGCFYGISNFVGGMPSGKHDVRNIRIRTENHKFRVDFPDGTIRVYEHKNGLTFLLEKEILPHGKVLKYHYDHKALTSIESMDSNESTIYSSLEVHGFPYLNEQEFIGSNFTKATYKYGYQVAEGKGKDGGAKFEYSINSPRLLTSVESPLSGKETISYSDIISLTEYKTPKGFFHCSYEAVESPDNAPHYRTSHIAFPSGMIGEISYLPRKKGGQTTFKHASGTKTVYEYTDNLLLQSVKTISPEGTLKKIKVFEWDSNQRLSSLQFFEGDKLLCQKHYEYDAFGNPTLETITGETITFSIRREFSQDGRNLLLREEEEEGKAVVFEYVSGTNLPLSKMSLDGEIIFQREFWEYDDSLNLIQKIVDDGDSGTAQRRITRYILRQETPFLHMPEWIQECYCEGGEEKPLKKTHLSYDQYGNVSQEDIYDAAGNFAYSLFKEYDQRGNLLSETNPLGQKALYTYNDGSLLTSSVSFSGRLKKEFTYDLRSRLITEKHYGSEGGYKSFQYEYDLNDLIVKKIINEQNATLIKNDPVVLKPALVEYPSTQERKVQVAIEYDALGREIAKTDPNGNTTRTRSNLYGSPLEIIYPDGTRESFTYSKQGHLTRHVNQEGTEIVYERDVLGRVLTKTIYSSSGEELASESFIYNAFHLIQETDKDGCTTHYSYDGAGRKIKEVKEGRTLEYIYDSLGRLATLKKGPLFQHYEYDLLDRTIKETKTDADGEILFEIGYEYDTDDNRSALIKNQAKETFTYDAFNRVTMHTDALGNHTSTAYDDRWKTASGHYVLKTVSIDPKGLSKQTMYDSFDRIVKEEACDQKGETLFSRQRTYDACGNLVSLNDGSQTITFSYDCMNRLKSETASGKRRVEYAYTPMGKIAEKTLPDGIKLYFGYNPLGFMETLSSSDGSLNLCYCYNKKGDVLEAADVNQSLSITREYDPFGNILKETSAQGLVLEKEYDHLDRPLFIRFPEGVIEYSYDALYPRRVARYNTDHDLLYEHTFNSYDLSGNLLEESMIGGLGTIYTSYDEMGRKLSVSSPFISQNCVFNELGNLIKSTLNDRENFYDYDALSQLTSENDHTYCFDTLFNRLQKDDEYFAYNDLNELVSKSYDRRGNLTSDGQFSFKYDPLNRLVEAQNNAFKITYSYDPLGRRVSKTTACCSPEKRKEHYLYDDDQELACYEGELKDLRVFGLPSQPVAIELSGRAFAPILDCLGNVKKLVDVAAEKITHSYTYSAFGETLSSETRSNPYRYAGKRCDFETGLINFGKRYYNPALARWMTTDPAGIKDSTNLYQYLFNNPFKYTDPDGAFVIVVPIALELIFGAAAIETVASAVLAATVTYLFYESVPYIENWMNQSFRDGVPYEWDHFGWNPEGPADYGFEWKGRGSPSSGKGNWVKGDEKLNPDFDHKPPIGPHWDYKPEKKHKGYRLYPDGRCEPKNKGKNKKKGK